MTQSTQQQQPRTFVELIAAVHALGRTGLVSRALDELDRVRDEVKSARRSSVAVAGDLDARLALEEAHLHWLGIGRREHFTLTSALDAAMRARALLAPEASGELAAEAAALVASIACDLGDNASLDMAERVVTDTTAAILLAGKAKVAATLLNDHAMLLMRLGNFVKAKEALSQSLALVDDDVEERAQTHHALARLPLHCVVSDQEMREAFVHAAHAAALYEEQGLPRELGRVWETRGRLHARRGEINAAFTDYMAAIRMADEVGDVTGLAKVSAGLAELLAEIGKVPAAVELIASSIELNRQKGSPLGLVYDEQVLDAIESIVGRYPTDPKLAFALTEARIRLATS